MDVKETREQINFVEALFNNFISSAHDNLFNREHRPTRRYLNYMNKNCGKYALKRKITLLRQELLNLEKMIESE